MPTPQQSRRWIWFFVVVGLLAIAGITIPIVYNLGQQLKREDLERAMELWQENGPKSYNLRYVVKKGREDIEKYHAEVREGKVRIVYRNGRALSPAVWTYHDMKGRFADIKGFLDEDAKPGKPRVFVRATFDAKDGRLIHYLRSVSASRERVEIDVEVVSPVADENLDQAKSGP